MHLVWSINTRMKKLHCLIFPQTSPEVISAMDIDTFKNVELQHSTAMSYIRGEMTTQAADMKRFIEKELENQQGNLFIVGNSGFLRYN